MLISEQVTDLFGGVSQAPSAKRKPNQWTELLNALPIYGKRLGRRPPLLHITKLTNTVPASAAFEHPVVTSTGRRVHLVVLNGELTAYDADTGASINVVTPDDISYLSSGTLKAASNGDTTLLLNTGVRVARAADSAPSKRYEALIYVRQGDYSTTYTVTIGSTPFTYTTPDTGVAGALAATATDKIAAALLALFAADVSTAANYYMTLYGSTIYVTRKDAAEFSVFSTDGIADKGIVLVKGSIQRFADLPPRCRPGVVVEVTGDESTTFDNYFVQYQSPSANVQGVWKEVVKPGALVALDAGTLPYQCTFQGDLMPETKHEAPPLPTLSFPGGVFRWTLSCRHDVVYPAGMPLVLQIGVDFFPYTVGSTPEDAATVSAGIGALVAANPTYVVTRLNAEEFDITLAAPGIFIPLMHGGFNPAIIFATTTSIRTGLVGYTIKNLTDGSEGVITESHPGYIVVAALTGGVTNLFNAGDECVVVGAGDYFLLSQAPWAPRAAGDDTTVPFPSVVGKTLNEVFFHQGRLGLTSGSGVLLSRAGDLFNLFRTTATAILSDDPIDVQNALGDASPFHSAVEWNGALYLFSRLKQYTLAAENDGPITPTTVRLRAVSSYQNDSRVRPVTAGNRLYFTAAKGGYTRVLEYTIRGFEQSHEAADIGLHIPTYIQGNALRLAVDETQGVLLLLTDGLFQRSLYAYTSRYEDGEKVAAGWGRWDFAGGTILTIGCVDGKVAVIRSFSDGTFLESLLLDPQALASYDIYLDGSRLLDGSFLIGAGNAIGLERIAYLDRRVSLNTAGVSVAFSAGVTTWTLPYSVAVDGSEGTLAVTREQGATVLTTTRPAPNQVAAVGDYSTSAVYIGVRYTTGWTFSTLFVRGKDGEPDVRGRLQLRFLRLRYADSTDLTVAVTVAGRVTATYTLANTTPATSTFLVPIQGRNEDVVVAVTNSTPGAGHLVSYDWEGTYHTRERAI